MELWDIYDIDRVKTGRTMVRGETYPPDAYHLVIHICLFRSDGKMLVQHRQPFKSGWSNMWDVTVGGSAVAGDNSQTAAERELAEEIGYHFDFAEKGVRPALSVNFDHGFDDIYIIKEDDVDLSKLHLQYEEVKEVKWANKEEIFAMIDAGEFIPYHRSFIELLFYLKDCASSTVVTDFTKA